MNVTLLRKYLSSQALEQKMSRRLERLQIAETNPIERMNVWMECAEDVFTFIDLFGVVYEPRLAESPDVPLFLFPHQREVITRILHAEERGEDLLIEKTRDMMITWTVLWYMYWRWLFREKWYGLVGSRKEEEVDDKTPQSIFGRLRYMHYSLPPWMRPSKFRKSEHDLHLKLINPDKMSFIDGESANSDFARGSRAAMIFLDEIFSWRFARESWRSCTDSSPCRIAVSTAKPSSFARGLRESFENQRKLLTLDWHQHPFKDEEWFQKERERRQDDPLSVLGELEISYQSDPTLAYYPEVLRCPVEDFDYNPAVPLHLGVDFGSQDKTSFVYFQRDAQKFYVLDAIERRQKKLSWYYPFLKQGFSFKDKDTYEVENRFTQEKFVLSKRDYLKDELALIERFNAWRAPVMLCGEAAHRQKMIKSNTSIVQELAGIGVALRINDLGIAHSIRRNATKKMLGSTVFSGRYGALDVYDALANARFVEGRQNSASEEAKDKPVHDETADLRAAVENFAVNVVGSTGGVRVIPYRRR